MKKLNDFNEMMRKLEPYMPKKEKPFVYWGEWIKPSLRLRHN